MIEYKRGLLLILLILLPSLSPAGSAKPRFGLVTNLDTDGIADRVSELGVTWVRLTVYWNQVEKSKGRFDWSAPDAQISRATERGLRVFITIHATPQWANGHRSEAVPPTHSQDWKDFVAAVAERYKSQPAVRAYGMWNEPNLQKFWTGSQKQYVNKILIPGHEAIKKVNPDLLVGAPEMSQHWVGSSEWNLEDILNSAGTYIDVVTQHYYPDPDEPFDSFLDKQLRPHRSGKRVWITECGIVACSNVRCSEDQQSHYLLSLLKTQKARSTWVKKIFPYRIWDPVDACDSAGNGFGLTYGNPIRKRPSYNTYRDFIDRLPFDDPAPRCHPVQ